MKYIFNLQKSCFVKFKATGKNTLHLYENKSILTEKDLYRLYENANKTK